MTHDAETQISGGFVFNKSEHTWFCYPFPGNVADDVRVYVANEDTHGDRASVIWSGYMCASSGKAITYGKAVLAAAKLADRINKK